MLIQAGSLGRALGLLSRMPQALIVCLADRRLLYANPEALRLQQQGELTLSAQHLMRLGQLRAPALQSLLASAAGGAAAESSLWFEPGWGTGVLHVEPLSDDLIETVGWPAGSLRLLVQHDRPQLAQAARLEAVSARCGLSAAERQVLRLLADGSSVDATAQSLGLCVSTVRTHVRQLLAKSGSRSLMQLLRWVGSSREAPDH